MSPSNGKVGMPTEQEIPPPHGGPAPHREKISTPNGDGNRDGDRDQFSSGDGDRDKDKDQFSLHPRTCFPTSRDISITIPTFHSRLDKNFIPASFY